MPTEQESGGYRRKADDNAETAFFVGAVAAIAMFAIAYLAFSAQPAPPHQASPYVKVLITGGFGSGVHIGNGYVLTASHVVTAEHQMTLETDTGAKVQADIMWANDASDVALLKIATGDVPSLGVATLGCAPPTNGEAVTAYGSAEEAPFVSTAGRLVGKVSTVGRWKDAIYADMTILPGMSGGAVVGADGTVRGLSVGVMSTDVQTEVGTIGVAPSGIGVVVPSSVVCMLMDRH